MKVNPVEDRAGSGYCSITETGGENKLSDRELKASCYEYAQAYFQGKKFHNKETNSFMEDQDKVTGPDPFYQNLGSIARKSCL
jgi:hypothetical protein